MKYSKLAINDPKDLMFGFAPNPVTTKRGLCFGKGIVYPELNFTLPPIKISMETLPEILEQYKGILEEAFIRAIDLQSQGLVFEFETLLEMTRTPEIGIEILKVMNETCDEYYHKFQIPCEIRLTPNDLREFERPPRSRSSELLEPMFRLFKEGAKAGGDILSIESTGGKELSDDALMMCDIKAAFFALAVLGVRDMKFLWRNIVDIANQEHKIAGGDTACGFANTAMILAEKKFIPKVFAATIRILSVVRTIVAHEEGASGPDKDCGYEGPFLKTIAGIPISMEGKSAACAHFSPLGNIAATCADLWSNESVQNIKLLSGMAPTVSYEQLEYDTRLLNQSIKNGKESILHLQNLLVGSDAMLDPQALILSPEHVVSISRELIKGDSYVENAKNGCLKALKIMEEAKGSGELVLEEKEYSWISPLVEEIESIPAEEEKFIEQMRPLVDSSKYLPSEYGIFD